MIFLRPGNPVAWRAAPHRRVRRGIGINVTVGRSAMQTGGRRAGPPRPVAPPCLRFVVGDVVAAQEDKLTAVAAPAALGPGRRLRRAGGLAGADAAARRLATRCGRGLMKSVRSGLRAPSRHRDRAAAKSAGSSLLRSRSLSVLPIPSGPANPHAGAISELPRCLTHHEVPVRAALYDAGLAARRRRAAGHVVQGDTCTK